ncbi:hypothetical protein [Inhella sp.]|uniref:hypothetical protein n=1 Tax=Inhella sp. TaxID=1921806 RepID=UPI0035B31F14
MFRLQADQLQRLEQGLAAQYSQELQAHAREFAPALTQLMGAPALAALVERAQQRAAAHGLDCRGAVRFYLELMLLLGSDCDSDPQYQALLGPTLADREEGALARADRLHEILLAYIDAVSGPAHALEAAAAQAGLQWEFERLQALAQRPPGEWVGALAAAWPAKAKVVGPAALEALVRAAQAQAAEWAQQRGPAWHAAGPLLAALMLSFGRGWLQDPQFGWLSQTLQGPVGEAAEPALRRLHRRYLAFLQQTRDLLAAA